MSESINMEMCPVYAPFFGAMGVTAAIVFTCMYMDAARAC